MNCKHQSFVVRVFREQDKSIRGIIQEISSGEEKHFLGLKELQELLFRAVYPQKQEKGGTKTTRHD